MIDENTKILSLEPLSVLLRAKLVMHHFDTLGDLLNYGVQNLVNLDGITCDDVLAIMDLIDGYYLENGLSV